MIKLTLISSLILMMACNGAKETTAQVVEDMSQQNEMIAKGFTKGTIVYSDIEGDCEYTIKLEDGRFFESLDLKEDFMKDGMIVWFTYGPLRRMNKCTKANPVGIKEMLKG
ncbi:hypothetical protein [Patiriisocius sp. Uisw_047]|jgi:hypothetical protein|uniref:hypothetical protein n=1 Tax=Patiriisocius sp. Uisw_047 TaxID=3230969 RepID=UPI0039ED9131